MKTMNKMKTIAAAAVLAVSLGASAAMTYNQGYGTGVVIWYDSACEEMTDRGSQSFVGMLYNNGMITAEAIASTPGVNNGFYDASNLGCSGTQRVLIESGLYARLF